MIINNLEQIKPLLTFSNDDIFYFLTILKRKKEHKELGSNSVVIKTYYISSLEYLDLKWDEITTLCKLHQARAYINLTSRSFKRTAFHTLKKITDCILNDDFKAVRKAYDSCCGSYSIGEKRWIVDIDEKEISPLILAHIEYGCDPISKFESDFLGFGVDFNSKIITKIPTKNGWHLITKPFNRKQFSDKYPEIDIQTNNPTICYMEYL